MATKIERETHTKPVRLRVRKAVIDLIDRAAGAHGKTRSDFVIDAARRAAEDALLDQTLVKVDCKSFQHYLDALDQPPSGEGFIRLMNARKPWQP